MKILCLIRHAKSSWDDPSLPDQERPLNKRGLRDAPLMGQRLADHLMRVDAVWTSPALRAVETARLIAKAVKFPQKEIKLCDRFYTSSVHDLLLEISTCPDKVKTLLVFGHNPVISEFADLLISQDRDADIGSIPTCGIVAIELALSSWQKVRADAGRLLFFDYPKKSGTPV
jgi:phosphohistidine phosphatase